MNCIKLYTLLIQGYTQFWFFRKRLGIVSLTHPTHATYDLSKKIFLMLYSIN